MLKPVPNPDKQSQSDAFFARANGKLDFGQWSEKEKLALSCRILASEGHSETLAGQLTVRQEDGTFLTTSMACGFDEVTADRVIRINEDMQVLEGTGTPNPAVRFHFWVYRQRPDAQCIIHTHPPYVSTLAMTGQPLVVAHMDATPFHNDCAHLKEWPGLPIADEEGEIISAALGKKRCILLANHGFLAAGAYIEEALYLSVLIERAARNQLLAAAAYGGIKPVKDELAAEAHDFLLKPSIVRASFAMFARRVERQST